MTKDDPMDAPFYENAAVIGSSLRQPRSQVSLKLAASLSVRRALDLGCGDGELSIELAKATGAEVVCGDISALAVEACRRRGLDAYQVSLGTAPLPFADETFGLVHMEEVLEHLVRPDRAMDEVRRVLEPRGHLVLSTPNLACLPNRVLVPLGFQPLFSEVSEDRVLGRGLPIFGQGRQPVGHLRVYTKRALIEFMRLSGFDVVTVRGAAFHWDGPLMRIERALAAFSGLAMDLVVLARKA
jgi:SAM-dependent methyltransferase